MTVRKWAVAIGLAFVMSLVLTYFQLDWIALIAFPSVLGGYVFGYTQATLIENNLTWRDLLKSLLS